MGRSHRQRHMSAGWLVAAAVALLALAVVPAAWANPFVTHDLGSGLTGANLASSLAGPGVTVTNVSVTGADRALGEFTGGTGIIGFNQGVVLSSGDIANIIGPNNSTKAGYAQDTSVDAAGDALLSALAGEPTYDAAILEFDVTPATADHVYFQYVFASEEYNEWVNSQFNDVFAFWVNGTNYATVGDPPVPVTINTINDGKPIGTPPISHPELYINNDFQWYPPDPMPAGAVNTQMDGLTTTLSFSAPVNVGVPNHFKLAIADSSDYVLDSVVLIRASSLGVDTTAPVTHVSGADANWHNTPQTLTFSADDAGSGVHYTEYKIGSGAWTTLVGTTLVIDAPVDHSNDGVNVISYRSVDNAANTEATKTATVRIDTTPPTPLVTSAVSVKKGKTGTIKFKVTDPLPNGKQATVILKIIKGKTKVMKTFKLGHEPVNKNLKYAFKASLPKGTYKILAYATDLAGNTQTAIGVNTLKVKK